ncbi:Hsp20/alpha crystallin family protein [Catalinimonas sp. 4WD22]|uniref:Hsp20/alpha crystallin family protein n=1 Tax=Catalinimonas locisalis TaxID=3133978 RepID=UPI0031012077
MRPHILHNGLHRIGDEPARIFDNERFLSRDPFDDLWMTRHETPATNIKENEEAYDLEIALPGFTKDEISIEVNDELLNVTAEKTKDKAKDFRPNYIRREYNTKSLYRGFSLPRYINREDIEAYFEHGILRIRLPHDKNTSITHKVMVE